MDTSSSSPSQLQRVLAYLDENKVEYKSLLNHVETRTSEESAQVRGVDLSTGGKALLLKLGDDESFGLFVMSASRQLNSKAIKKELKAKNVRFATREELAQRTDGLVPGSVPPFGRPIFAFDLYLDTSITMNSLGHYYL